MGTAIIDIDRVVADCTKREIYAKDTAYMVTNRAAPYLDEKEMEDLKKKVFYHKDTFYKEELVLKDELIPNARESIYAIRNSGYSISYLTSRPSYLLNATRKWIRKHDLPVDGNIYCKDMDFFRFVKTALWKPGAVELLIYALNIEYLCFVDDEEPIREAVLSLAEKTGCKIRVCESLKK
jgi:hypothetical protein